VPPGSYLVGFRARDRKGNETVTNPRRGRLAVSVRSPRGSRG
jgi:hypothetical protein